MANDLANLYRELENENQTPEILRVKKSIETKLNDRLRENMMDMLEIGDVLGFGRLEAELKTAADIVGKAKNIRGE